MQIRKWKAYQRVKPNAQQPFQAIASFVEVHACVPQNFLSLTENNQFRTSQLREAAERYGQVKKNDTIKLKYS